MLVHLRLKWSGRVHTIVNAQPVYHFPSDEKPQQDQGRHNHEAENLRSIVDQEQGVSIMYCHEHGI